MPQNDREQGRPKWTDIASALAAVALTIISLVGLVLVVGELTELRRQNALLERTLKQTFRPLGVAGYFNDSIQTSIVLEQLPGPKPGKWSFSCKPRLHNRGSGVLLYLGSFSFISKKECDFRAEFRAGRIDSVNYDGFYPYMRRTPVLPGGYYDTFIMWTNLEIEEQYFLYVIFPYEDQDGGLYDTQHLDVLRFNPMPEQTPRGPIPQLSKFYSRETYHYYSADETVQLVEQIRRANPSFARIIELDQ